MVLPNLTNTNSDSMEAASDDSQTSLETAFSRSADEKLSIDGEDKTTAAMSKKVRFSQPLEFWKEFDRDNELFLDWNYNAKLQHSKEDEIGQRKMIDKTEKCCKEKRRTKGKPVRTITEAVQAFQLEEEKTSVRKFIAHYKRTSVNIPTTRVIHRKVHNTIISEFEKIPSSSIDSEVEGNNGGICDLCSSYESGLYCEKHQQHILNSSSNLQMQDSKNFTALKPLTQRTSKLPTLYNGRKLFEERLLPHTANHNNYALRDVNYGYLKSDYRGIPLVQRTPFIVQLFE